MRYADISKYELMSSDVTRVVYHLSEDHKPNFDFAQRVICGAIIPRRKTWSHLHYSNSNTFEEEFFKIGYALCHYCEDIAFNTTPLDEDGEWFELQ